MNKNIINNAKERLFAALPKTKPDTLLYQGQFITVGTNRYKEWVEVCCAYDEDKSGKEIDPLSLPFKPIESGRLMKVYLPYNDNTLYLSVEYEGTKRKHLSFGDLVGFRIKNPDGALVFTTGKYGVILYYIER